MLEEVKKLKKEFEYIMILEKESYEELAKLLKIYGDSYMIHLEKDYKWKETQGCDSIFLNRLILLETKMKQNQLSKEQIKKYMNQMYRLYYEIKKANQVANEKFDDTSKKRFSMLAGLDKGFSNILIHCNDLVRERACKYVRFENLWNQIMIRNFSVENSDKQLHKVTFSTDIQTKV